MNRLTTNDPKDNVENALNLFYAKDGETWVRGGGSEPNFEDISLYDFTREAVKKNGLNISSDENDAMAETLYELLIEGTDSAEGIVALLYTAAWAFSELRERLKSYEDIGTIEHYAELAKKECAE